MEETHLISLLQNDTETYEKIENLLLVKELITQVDTDLINLFSKKI